jgi:hypothetical protein
MGIPDSKSLAGLVESLGGRMVEHESAFRFTLPRAAVETAIPKISALDSAIGVRRVSERVEPDPARPRSERTVMELELFRRQPESKSDYSMERNLMAAIIR